MRETAASPFIFCNEESTVLALKKKKSYASIMEICEKFTKVNSITLEFNFSETWLYITLDTL